MLGRRKRLVASDQPRGKVDNEDRRWAICSHEPLERCGQEVQAAWSSPICRREAQLFEKTVVAWFKSAEPIEQVEAGDPLISSFFQRVRKRAGERHGGDGSWCRFMNLKVARIAGKDELAPEGQETP